MYHSYKGHVGKTQRSFCESRETATFDKPTFSPKNATDRIKLKVGLVATTKEKTKDASMRRLLTLLPSVTFPTHILPYLESYQNVSPLCYWCAFSQCLVRNVLSRHNRKIASFIIRLHNHGDTWWPYIVLQQDDPYVISIYLCKLLPFPIFQDTFSRKKKNRTSICIRGD